MPQSAARRNDTNDVDAPRVPHRVGDNQDKMRTGAPDGLPTFLVTFDAVLEHQGERIVKDARRCVETDTVLGEVAPRLRRVPFEPEHGWYVTTI